MKIMRMATGRGKSHFNITDFLQPFVEHENLVRYPFLNIDEDHQIIRDKTSYLPACTYSDKSYSLGDSCNLFAPVPTDLGICYSFNAKSSMKMLKMVSFIREIVRYILILLVNVFFLNFNSLKQHLAVKLKFKTSTSVYTAPWSEALAE